MNKGKMKMKAPKPIIVEKFGIKRKQGFLYFLRGSDVWQVMFNNTGRAKKIKPAKIIARGNFIRQDGYLYYLNADGDAAAVKRPGYRQKEIAPSPIVLKKRKRKGCNHSCSACCG